MNTSAALTSDDFDELDTLLDDLRTRDEEVPQWEFCEGFLAAVVCTREPISDEEAVDALLPEFEGETPLFASPEQKARFLALWARRRAESADRASSMPEIVVRGLHRHTDAAGNLIPRNHRAQQQIHICAARLCRRQRRRDGRAAGMIDGVAIDIVEFHGMRRRAIQQRRVTERHLTAAHVTDRTAAAARFILKRG